MLGLDITQYNAPRPDPPSDEERDRNTEELQLVTINILERLELLRAERDSFKESDDT